MSEPKRQHDLSFAKSLYFFNITANKVNSLVYECENHLFLFLCFCSFEFLLSVLYVFMQSNIDMFLCIGSTFWWSGQSTVLFVTPAYSWDWYCRGPMCSNFGITCYRTPMFGDQGGNPFHSAIVQILFSLYYSWPCEPEFSLLGWCNLLHASFAHICSIFF